MHKSSELDVLIIEDDSAAAELERRALARAGIGVTIARTLREAKEALLERRFQAILLDYQLPDGDPWEIVEIGRGLSPSVPVVLVTGHGNENLVADAMQRGVAEYVRKSESFWEQLAGTVQRVAKLAQAEAKLKKSDALLALISNYTNDLILTLDQAAVIRFASPSAKAVLGFESRELVGIALSELVHAHDRRELLETARMSEAGIRKVLRCRRRDGGYIWVEIDLQSVPGLAPISEAAFLVVLRDVTQRKIAEQNLRQSEARFRGAFETAAHGMALVSAEGRWLRVNKAICDIVGYAEAELLATDFQSITHPEDLNADLDLVRQLLDGAIANYQMEKRYFHKDGRTIWVLLSVSLVRDDVGEPVHFVSQIIDITARRDAEAKLALAHKELAADMERWEALAHASRDMIVCYLPDTTMTYVSPASLSALGYAPEELIGRRIQDFIHPDDVSRGAKDLGRVAKAGPDGPSLNMRLRARHKDGGWRWVEGRPRPLIDAQTRSIKAYYDVMRDVSEQVAMEQSLAGALARSELGARAKADFLANMSHELRTPLNSVIGYARLLGQSGDLHERDHLFAQLVQAAGETTLSIVNDVLDASALEGGKLVLHLGPFSLRDILIEVAAMVSLHADAKDLALHVDVDPQIVSLCGDRNRIKQVLLNLASNAIKFTSEGEVTLAAALENDGQQAQSIRIEVRDTGAGIDAGELPFVFERFVQVGAHPNASSRGSGLGLAIVKDLVDLMDGQIGVDTKPGCGSTFHVALSLPKASPLEFAPRPVAAAAASLVLAVDDVDINRELIVLMLEPHGHKVETAADGAEAVAKAAATQFDAIFMDVRMPGMDGLEAARAIRASGASSQTPIIAVTAGVRSEQVAACLSAGMNICLPKPVDEASLLHTLADWTSPLPPLLADVIPSTSLRLRFAQRLADDRVALEANEDRDTILALAHRMAGAAGSFGFSAIGDLAGALEDALERDASDWRDKRQALVSSIDDALRGEAA